MKATRFRGVVVRCDSRGAWIPSKEGGEILAREVQAPVGTVLEFSIEATSQGTFASAVEVSGTQPKFAPLGMTEQSSYFQQGGPGSELFDKLPHEYPTGGRPRGKWSM